MTQTLWFATAASLLTALLYLYVGAVLRQREVGSDARLANNMFVLWWQCLGGVGLLGALVNLLYLAGGLEVWFYWGFAHFVFVILYLALWGLQFYLMYVYTGSKASFVPLGLFYGALFFATAILFAYVGQPQAITDNGWSLRMEPETEFGLAFNLGFIALIAGPQIVAAIAYARLYHKAVDRTQRYRIALVTTSILVWFGASIVATALQADEDVWWQVTSRIIGVLGALGILAAFKPPAFVQRRLDVQPVKVGTG